MNRKVNTRLCPVGLRLRSNSESDAGYPADCVCYTRSTMVLLPSHMILISSHTVGRGGSVDRLIERATDNRVVARSNPTETAWKLWQFPLPHFASVFRKRH